MKLLLSVLALSVALLNVDLAKAQGNEYGIRLQPELDSIDVESYLTNDRLFNLQMNCILFDGPCDSVGRWMKRKISNSIHCNPHNVEPVAQDVSLKFTARIPAALLGNCLQCTPKQEQNMAKILSYIVSTKPDLYRVAVTKYLQTSGTDVPADEAKKVEALRQTVASPDS